MDRNRIIAQFEGLNVWKRGGQRAPHKPLLVLLALGDWLSRNRQELPFAEVEPKLTELLKEFGPPRKSFHPEYPFCRLQNDGLWLVSSVDGAELRTGQTDIKKSELLRTGAVGAFPAELYKQFSRDPDLVYDIAEAVLGAHFPESMHNDIRQAVGIEFRYSLRAEPLRTRDPQFRYQILTAYQRKCAVCSYSVRLGDTLIGLEAAHIKWFQAGGPDSPDNGLALCSLHHKLLDRGAYTISFSRTIEVSEYVNGAAGLEEWLLRYAGRSLDAPVNSEYSPKDEFIDWHHREVFKGPARPAEVGP